MCNWFNSKRRRAPQKLSLIGIVPSVLACVCLLAMCIIAGLNIGLFNVIRKRWLSSTKIRPSNNVSTATQVVLNGNVCHTPRDAKTNLLDFLNQSDIQKRHRKIEIPFFTAGSYLAVTRADSYSPTGTTKFVGICIARRSKGLGSTFILRNVINGIGVEIMYELYSPAIKEIQVLKLERRRRAKLYYLRDKPPKYSTVSERMQPVPNNGEPSVYKRKKGAPA